MPLDELEQEVARVARTWDDLLADELIARSGDAEGHRLARRYSARLPDYYKTATPTELALKDIDLLERVAAGEEFAVGLQNERREHTQAGARPLTRVTVAAPGGKIPLGELLPVLEALGLTVMEEVPTRLDGGDDGAYLHDFGVLVDDAQIDCERDGERFAQAITAIWSGRVRVRHAQRPGHSRRTRCRRGGHPAGSRRCRRIIAPTFTAPYQNDVLSAHPKTARALVELFRARFCDEPDEAREGKMRAQLDEQLAAVGSLDEDRILRGFVALMGATVRTNAALGRDLPVVRAALGRHPRICPAPRRSSRSSSTTPRVEGIHLRGGRTSRAAGSAGGTTARTTAPRCSV